ncbi:hypothetical protein GCM10011428_26860 [Streptomyces violaceus]
MDQQPVLVDLHRAARDRGVPHRFRRPQPHLRQAHATVPRGAQASSPAVVTRRVSQASPPSSGSSNGSGTAGRLARPQIGQFGGSGQRAAVGEGQLPRARQPVQAAEVLVVAQDDALVPEALDPYRRRDLPCSNITGLGVRSGKTTPSAMKAPSWSVSPKSPPYAQRCPGAATPLS